MSNLLRSLFLSLLFSFATPWVIILLLWGLFTLFTYFPAIATFGQGGIHSLYDVLKVFGSGYPLQGIVVMGVVCSTVGGLFDLYNFYLYQGVKRLEGKATEGFEVNSDDFPIPLLKA